MNCNLKNTETLFNIISNINKKLGSNCFLKGAYVFEDPENTIFNYLYDKNNCKDITRDRGTKCATSHDWFFNDKRFKQIRAGKSTKYTVESNDFNKTTFLGKIKNSMFEKLLKSGFFLSCDNKNFEPAVMLFFPFKLKDNNGVIKQYLYLKLETSRCFGAAHVKHFIEFQAKKRLKKSQKDTMATRREDEKYTPSLKAADDQLYSTFNSVNFTNKINDYNENIRTGAELFIPVELYNSMNFIDKFNQVKLKPIKLKSKINKLFILLIIGLFIGLFIILKKK